jgi:hypothetical protein
MCESAHSKGKAMTAWRGQVALAAAILALVFVGSAGAQENLDSGKTPAQLFASDCAICHKTPSGLSKGGNALGGLRGLQGFLREHYTASREAAAAVAAYVQAADRGPPRREPKHAAKPKEPKEKAKPGEAKPDGTTDSKTDAKIDAKPDAKGTEAKPAESKPSESAETPAAAKAEAAKPAAKPESKSETKSESKSDGGAKPESDKKSD